MRVLTQLLLAALAGLAAAGEAGVMFRLDGKPLYYETDHGGTDKEKRAFILRFAKPIGETAEFFLKVYQLKPTAFDEYANYYDPQNKDYDRLIRVRIFANYDAFLVDFQKRYESKAIPGAFFGINHAKDEYGQKAGKWLREVGTAAEGQTDEQVLRHLYHELGHLFMRTFIIYQVEVPSWIEEGTAELFQFRKGNGTNPEEERDQRSAWLVEMIAEGSSIPWDAFIKVRNLDNLDFTYQDPMRSTIQYAQAWSVMEFMIDPKVPQRAQAFTKLLKDFKDEGRKITIEANRQRLEREAWFARVQPHLYSVQEALFKKNYGADLVSVEGKWKDWVRKNYDTIVAKRPIMRYYRGEWHLIRASYAREDDKREGALSRAEELFNEAVAATPDLPEAYVGLGRVFLMRGMASAADAQFAKAIEAGTDNFEALLYGGMAKIRGNKAGDAVAALTRAVEQRPSHFEANFYLGQALAISQQDPDRALVHLKRIMDSRRDMTAQVAVYEALVHYQRGNLDQANLSLLRAGSVNPGDQSIQAMRAIVKLENNEIEEGTAILEAAKNAGWSSAIALLQRIQAKQPLPKLGFDRAGYPTFVDPLRQPEGAQRPRRAAEEKPAEDKPAEEPAAEPKPVDGASVDEKAKELFGEGE